MPILRRAVLIALPWLIVIGLWYAIAYSGLINPALVPTPHRVARRFWELLTTARLPLDILMSTQRVVIGVALGIVAAVPVGFLISCSRIITSSMWHLMMACAMAS